MNADVFPKNYFIWHCLYLKYFCRISIWRKYSQNGKNFKHYICFSETTMTTIFKTIDFQSFILKYIIHTLSFYTNRQSLCFNFLNLTCLFNFVFITKVVKCIKNSQFFSPSKRQQVWYFNDKNFFFSATTLSFLATFYLMPFFCPFRHSPTVSSSCILVAPFHSGHFCTKFAQKN